MEEVPVGRHGREFHRGLTASDQRDYRRQHSFHRQHSTDRRTHRRTCSRTRDRYGAGPKRGRAVIKHLFVVEPVMLVSGNEPHDISNLQIEIYLTPTASSGGTSPAAPPPCGGSQLSPNSKINLPSCSTG